ncbi:MAG TPA: AAA family ATPase [Bryobacteraceae bacterium]|nr:AAA family ATPase [Bryobacteraceae bacterium]
MHAIHSSLDNIKSTQLERTGYLMINSCEISNFRCFKELKLGGLRRFNIIVGESGSGKTALLEALFLVGGGSPEVYLRLRKWRGYGDTIRLTGTRGSYESIFRDLFYSLNQSAEARLKIQDSVSGTRSLVISYSGQEQYNVPLRRTIDNVFLVDPIRFHWTAGKKSFESKVQIKDGGINIAGFGDVYPAWLISPAIGGENYAQHFSDLSKKGKARPLIDALKLQFPYIKDVTLESLVGELMLYVSVEQLDEKIPIGLLSAGMNKYLWILIAIASSPGGVVLIDEIENGFYYKSLTPFMRSIYSFCEEQNVQLIASTHSYELLQSIIPLFDEDESREERFTLLRAERERRDSHIKLIRGSSYRAAIEEHFEVRG